MVFTEANKELEHSRTKSKDSEKVKTGVHGGRNHLVRKADWLVDCGLAFYQVLDSG